LAFFLPSLHLYLSSYLSKKGAYVLGLVGSVFRLDPAPYVLPRDLSGFFVQKDDFLPLRKQGTLFFFGARSSRRMHRFPPEQLLFSLCGDAFPPGTPVLWISSIGGLPYGNIAFSRSLPFADRNLFFLLGGGAFSRGLTLILAAAIPPKPITFS